MAHASTTQPTISPDQSRTILRHIRQWARLETDALRSRMDPREAETFAFAGCWSVFKKRFGIDKYTSLPASQYDAALAFIDSRARRAACSTQPPAPLILVPIRVPHGLLPELSRLISHMSDADI